tara:strand:+ start:4262 stop:5872 length:1611 start_codon:yes stop_codon:yes gene_type:complete
MNITKNSWFLGITSGLLFAISWPTWGHPIFLFFAFIPLFIIEENISLDGNKRKKLRVWVYSYLSFLIWNILTTWWLINASFIGMLIANIFNSLFFSLLFLCFHIIKKHLPIKGSYIFFISIWICFEKLHLTWDITWPWLNLGNGFSEHIYWVQWYEYTGTFGGTLWILILNIGFFECWKLIKKDFSKSFIIRKLLSWFTLIVIPIIFSLLIYINIPISNESINVLVVQPNIDPYKEKYNFSNLDFVEKLKEQILDFENEKIDFILAPETYFASGYGEELKNFQNTKLHKEIQNLLSKFQETQLISGIQFYNIYTNMTSTSTSNKIRENLWVDFYNSAISISYNKNLMSYHKSKLVPGVETLPYNEFLKPIFGNLLIDMGGTISTRASQNNREIFKHQTKKINAAPIICYESIYGDFVSEYIRLGADFLAVISNDGWWGNTPGHKQLISLTRLRAIENRRSIARSANTGISGFINHKGEYIKTIPYDTKGVLKGKIPLIKSETFYTKYGDFIARISILTSILYFLVALSGIYRPKFN